MLQYLDVGIERFYVRCVGHFCILVEGVELPRQRVYRVLPVLMYVHFSRYSLYRPDEREHVDGVGRYLPVL